MKHSLILITAATAFVALASGVPAVGVQGKGGKSLSPEELEARKAAALARTGGTVVIPGDGRMVIFDCQTQIPYDLIQTFATNFGNKMSITVPCMRGGAFSLGGATEALKGNSCGLGVFVIDDPAMPMSLLSIEAGWGVVNVAALAADKPDAARLARRFRLECQRIASLVASGGTSQYAGSVLQPVRTIDDIDNLASEGYTIDTVLASRRNLKAFGITPDRKMTYHRACVEGIAPAPTNDVQKAVWEKVHAVPKNPMKIEFDPKKGK